MALPDGFPEKELLEKQDPPYETVEDVKEATDEELLGINGIGGEKLKRIRAVAPYTPSPDEQGTGQTSTQTSGSTPPPSDNLAANTTGGQTGAASDPDNDPNTASDTQLFVDRPLTPTAPGGGGVGTFLEEETVKGEPPPNTRPGAKDPNTGLDLPKGIHMNERGTLTATTDSHESQPEVVHPRDLERIRRDRLRQLRDNLEAAFSQDL